MAKPFSIQSPEDVAKSYGGNKQRIAEAMQLGVVDPTAGVLAGMFIDRMRSAQIMEGSSPPTVAQQVMGGAPPAQQAPPLPAAGLGGTAPAAPPMTPPMPEQMSVGMAEGGLAGLPLPDTMFDEPDNGGYAAGGLVAFSGGGEIDRERLRRVLMEQESGGDYGVTNREGSGAMGAYQFMPDTARGLAKRLGMAYRPELLAGAKARTEEGKAYQEALMNAQLDDIIQFSGGDLRRAAAYHFAGPNQKGWGPKTRKYQDDIVRRYSGAKDDGKLPERDVQTSEGRFGSLMDQMEIARSLYGELPEGGLAELEAFYRKELDPQEQRARRKEDMWATLAQIGASMASSNSPFFLQAVGEAIGAALPGANASRKERLDAERDARKGLQEVLGLKRKEQKEVIEFANDLRAVELGAETNQMELETRVSEAAAEREFRAQEAALDRALQKEIEKARLARVPLSDLETMIQIQQYGTPEQKKALTEALVQRQQYSTRQGGADPMAGALSPQGGGGAEAPIMLGSM